MLSIEGIEIPNINTVPPGLHHVGSAPHRLPEPPPEDSCKVTPVAAALAAKALAELPVSGDSHSLIPDHLPGLLTKPSDAHGGESQGEGSKPVESLRVLELQLFSSVRKLSSKQSRAESLEQFKLNVQA